MHRNKIFLNCLENSVKILKKNSFLKNYLVCILTPSRCLKIPILLNLEFSWIENSRTLSISLQNFIKNYSIINKFLWELSYNLTRLWFVKISFKGKGFKIKKRRRTRSIKFFFYHSHMNVIILKKAKLKQKKKNKIIIKTWNFDNLQKTRQKIVDVRGLNIFTKRGLRSSRQIVRKKTGKKSNY